MSQDQLSIKLTVAGRIYPLTIKGDEEEGMRKAAQEINERIKVYGSKFAVRDKQDLLAMCALEFAHEAIALESSLNDFQKTLEEKLGETEEIISDYLETT